MIFVRSRPFRLAAALLLIAGAAAGEARAQYSRRNPIVEAVQKTRAAIVSIKVHRSDAEDSREIVGTGVVVDERGFVVTNHHLVAGAARIRVHLSDGTSHEAQVLIDESARDLAILRLRGDGPFQALELGPASDLMVGETVIAVGHPFGYTHTVSTGIISALGREITMPSGDVLTNLIQTDASINPGNSGGPLLNINGELIGINVALREGAQGIAFAINADQVKEVLSRQLSVLRMAGVCHGLTCSEKVQPDGPHRQRVVVARVSEETPAARAGVLPGDEILFVAGRPVGNRFDVERSLWGHHAGDKIPLRIVRQGKELVVPLTLAPRTGEQWAGTSPATPDSTPRSPTESDAAAASNR